MYPRALAVALLVLSGCAAAPVPEAHAPVAPPPPAPVAPVAASPAAPAIQAAPTEAAAPGPDDEIAALDDDVDEEPDASAAAIAPARKAPSAPVLALGDAEIEQRWKHDPASLGPISVGHAHGGLLFNGVQMPEGEHWIRTDPGRAWGTQETVDALTHIIGRVNERYPGAAPLTIGHLSAKNGGHLSPHVSHQSGRDADIGYYYRTPVRAFVTANADNLDLPRTWALVRAALRETDVDMIFMDRGVQRLLADYALANGEEPAFVDASFQSRGKNARAPIRHVKGHHNHIHFRFWSPVAEELGRRLARFIVLPKAPPPSAAGAVEVAGITFVSHRARSGDTLVVLAKHYGTTVEEIQRANGLKSIALRAGAVYKIPQWVAAKAPPAKPLARRPAAKPASRPAGPSGPAAP